VNGVLLERQRVKRPARPFALAVNKRATEKTEHPLAACRVPEHPVKRVLHFDAPQRPPS
jgi:hypothetical protein